MATPTVTVVMENVRARLDEASAIFWTDTDLRRWINETVRDMARRTESLRGKYDQTVVSGTATYTPAFTSTTIPYRLNRVEFIPTGQTTIYPLEYRDPNSADEVWGIMQAQEQGIPAIWTSWGAPPSLSIQLFPTPSQAGTLRIWYYRQPAAIALDGSDDTDTVDIVEGWEDVLVDGVEWKALRRDSDQRWTEAKQLYEQSLEAMMESTLRFTDAFGVITTPSGAYGPAWLYGGGTDFF